MDAESRDIFPVTPTEAIYRCRAQIRGLVFSTAPAKKIKTKEIISVMELMHFGFVYSRRFKQYFLFIDKYSGEDVEHEDYDYRYSVMELYVIRGNVPIFLDEFNIILFSPVYSSPSSPWHTFRDELSFHGNDGTYNKFLEAEWQVFVQENNVVCSEEIIISDSDSDY